MPRIPWCKSKNYWVESLFLLLACALLFGFQLGGYPLQVPDEGRYAEIAQAMARSGDFLVPYSNGLLYFEKPPLVYWLTAAAVKTAGNSEAVLRFWPAFLASLSVVATYACARKIYSRAVGLLAAGMMATGALFFVMAHALTLDMPVSALLSMSLLAFWRFQHSARGAQRGAVRYYYLALCLAALAVLTKGLMGAALPALIVGLWLLVSRRWSLILNWHTVLGGALVAGIVLPWHLLLQAKQPEFFQFYIVEQHLLRYLTDHAERVQPWWFFIPVLLLGFFPWAKRAGS